MARRPSLLPQAVGIICFTGALLILSARPIHGQTTAADTAAVLLTTARNTYLEGNRQLARALLRLVVRSYPGTAAAGDAQTQLVEWGRAADSTSGRVELIVWGTTYGAWLGIALPLAGGAESPEPFGAGLLLGTSIVRGPRLRADVPHQPGPGQNHPLREYVGRLAGRGVAAGAQHREPH